MRSGDQPNESIVPGKIEEDIRTVFLERVAAGEPLTEAERSRFDALILENPAEAWSLVEGIEDLSTRRFYGTLFFEALAAHDPELAAQILPGDASMVEKADWISVICIAAVGKGNLNLSQKLINERFPGGGRDLALGQMLPELFKSNAPSTVVEFWNLINPGSEKDVMAGDLARLLVSADPALALDWYAKIERPEEKRDAMGGMSAGIPDKIVDQIQAIEDRELQAFLARDLGTTLGGSQGEIGDYLDSVPAELIDDVELAYIHGLGIFGARMGVGPDIKLMEEYGRIAVTQEAKDHIQFMVASSEFSKDPKAAIETVRDAELTARNPDQWQSMLNRWLELDSVRASEYISGLEGDGVYPSAVQAMVRYLKNADLDDEAKLWEEHLLEEANEN